MTTETFHHSNQTHKETILRFIILFTMLVGYFVYMSQKFDTMTGLMISLLTWSFFVLCTPIADGGFIIAFPLRLLFGIKMMVTQIAVWFVAIAINVVALMWDYSIYDTTIVTSLLKKILTIPYPYWSILLVSSAGTGLSIYFGDEMMDVTKHKDRHKAHAHAFKHKIIILVAMGMIIFAAYYHLLETMHIEIPE